MGIGSPKSTFETSRFPLESRKFPIPTPPAAKKNGCNAHCRRGFKDSEKTEPDRSKRFLDICKKLCKIEAEIKDESIDLRYRRRQPDSVPLWDALFDRCREGKANMTVLPKSPLGRAWVYALKNETALRFYGTDGHWSINNNISERTLREFVIGRKNGLFFGSPDVSCKSAVLVNLLFCARRHGLNE
ncbi:MAG: IS66 family transposase [Planctomycetaceae bacterium]|jgi:transposase|nr:IS66 family transposase [Planctomycetaceae bacterium]